jgi:hypothetical protein
MDISNHKSSNYGAFLSNDEITKVIGLPKKVLSSVKSQLVSLGFTNVVVSGHNDHVRAFGAPLSLAAMLRLAPKLHGLIHSVHYKDDVSVPRKTLGLTRRQAIRAHYKKMVSLHLFSFLCSEKKKTILF